MTLWEKIQGAWNNPINVYYVIQAYYRIFLEKIGYLNKDLQMEIIMRKLHTGKKCNDNGECIACGCDTPELFYCNKGCKADFYLGQEPCFGPLENTPIKRCQKLLQTILQVGRKTGTKQ